MTIENIPIGSHVRQTIEAYAKMKSFPHTVLLDGADAKSRRELALFLAQTILCTGDARPCGSCNACIKCKAGVHPDIKEFGEIGSNAVFKIDAAREIKQDAFILPNDGDRKVYILLETQQMNDNAANALLKTLEEPPRYAHFILTCDSRASMLQTVLSRATVLGMSEPAAEREGEAAGLASDMARAVTALHESELLRLCGALEKDKALFTDCVSALSEIFKDALLLKSGANKQNLPYPASETVAAALGKERLYALYETCGQLLSAQKRNVNYTLLLTRLTYALRRAAGR